MVSNRRKFIANSLAGGALVAAMPVSAYNSGNSSPSTLLDIEARYARLDEIQQNLGDEIPSWVIEERRSNISERIQMLNDQMNGLTVCPLETDPLDF